MRVEFRQSSSTYQLRAGIRNDSSTWTDSSWFTISDAAHYIEIDWKASTGSGANNGYLTFWIDGNQQANLTGIDNDTRRVDRAQLGAVAGVDSGTRGTYYFDSLEAHRSTYIGPATAGFSGRGILARPALGLAEAPPLQGGGVVTTTITYDYDPLYRLMRADYNDGSYFDYTYRCMGTSRGKWW